MNPQQIIDIGRQALTLTLMLGAPLLLTALVVGLLIGMLQAATQINEMTLSFIPKLLAIGIVLLVAGPWMLRTLMDFTHALIVALPDLVR